MKYPIDPDTYIRNYESRTGTHVDEETKFMMRLIVNMKNNAYEEGFYAGKEAARHE